MIGTIKHINGNLKYNIDVCWLDTIKLIDPIKKMKKFYGELYLEKANKIIIINLLLLI